MLTWEPEVRVLVCYHEAGHALEYLRTGAGLRYVSVRPRGDYDGITVPRRSIGLWDGLGVCLAGAGGEIAYLHKAGVPLVDATDFVLASGRSDADLDNAGMTVRDVHVSGLLPKVAGRLWARWDALNRVALALEARTKLTGREVRELVA